MSDMTDPGARCISRRGKRCFNEANRIERPWWHWRRIFLGIVSEPGKCRWAERWWDRVGWTCEHQWPMPGAPSEADVIEGLHNKARAR